VTSPNGEVSAEQVKAELAGLRAGHPQGPVGSAGSVAGWTRPAPLAATGTLPGFPTGTLPGWLASFVQAVATATQTPPDLAGMLALSALATAAGGRVEVQPRAGWREPLNLFTAVALPPGNRKSAVFAEITRPLHDYERAAVATLAPAIAAAALAKKVAQERADKAQTAASKAPPDQAQRALAEAGALARDADAVQVPLPPRMLADDATPEALVSLLAGYGRIAILSPEGGVFDMMAGRYSRAGVGPPLDAYLKGHAGDPIRVDRKGREPEYAERPALTVGLAVQPDVLRALADQPGFRGRGLLARFLYAVPASTVGHRQVGAPPVPAAVRTNYHTQLQALCASLADLAEPALLEFDPAAERLLLAFEAAVEPRLGPAGDLGHLADWGAKLTGAAARLAGLLHLATHLRAGWARPVAAEQVAAAVQLAGYLTPHALAVFDAMGADPRTDDARWLLAWTTRTSTRQFTRRDAHQAARGRFRKPADLDPPLALLEEHGYLRRVDPEPAGPKGGRPPSPRFLVNPLHFTSQLSEPSQPHARQGSESSESCECAPTILTGHGAAEHLGSPPHVTSEPSELSEPQLPPGCEGSESSEGAPTLLTHRPARQDGQPPPSPYADGNDRHRTLAAAITVAAGGSPEDHADAERLVAEAPDLAALIDPGADDPTIPPWGDLAPLAWALLELDRRQAEGRLLSPDPGPDDPARWTR